MPSDRVFADARFAKLYGVDPELAKAGAPIAEFFRGIHPEDVDRVQAEVAKGMETGEPFSSEYRLPQPDGQDRWVVAQGRCVLSPEGKPLRFSGLSFDIPTEKKPKSGGSAGKADRRASATWTIRRTWPSRLPRSSAKRSMSAGPATAPSIRMQKR